MFNQNKGSKFSNWSAFLHLDQEFCKKKPDVQCSVLYMKGLVYIIVLYGDWAYQSEIEGCVSERCFSRNEASNVTVK